MTPKYVKYSYYIQGNKPDLSQSPANHIANIHLGCSTDQMRELLTDTSEETLMMWVV